MRWNRRLMLAVTAVTMMALGYAGTAQASTTIVDGGGTVTDDWGDHGKELGNYLCHGCGDSQRTDLVLMWQTILYAEGLLPKSGVDGTFGSATATATKKLQVRYGIANADGKVGGITWDRADNRLEWVKTSDHGWVVQYDSTGRGFAWFHRGSSGSSGSEGNYRLVLANNSSASPLIRFTHHEIQLFKRTIAVS